VLQASHGYSTAKRPTCSNASSSNWFRVRVRARVRDRDRVRVRDRPTHLQQRLEFGGARALGRQRARRAVSLGRGALRGGHERAHLPQVRVRVRVERLSLLLRGGHERAHLPHRGRARVQRGRARVQRGRAGRVQRGHAQGTRRAPPSDTPTCHTGDRVVRWWAYRGFRRDLGKLGNATLNNG
jgi:hypothetical protein